MTLSEEVRLAWIDAKEFVRLHKAGQLSASAKGEVLETAAVLEKADSLVWLSGETRFDRMAKRLRGIAAALR